MKPPHFRKNNQTWGVTHRLHLKEQVSTERHVDLGNGVQLGQTKGPGPGAVVGDHHSVRITVCPRNIFNKIASRPGIASSHHNRVVRNSLNLGTFLEVGLVADVGSVFLYHVDVNLLPNFLLHPRYIVSSTVNLERPGVPLSSGTDQINILLAHDPFGGVSDWHCSAADLFDGVKNVSFEKHSSTMLMNCLLCLIFWIVGYEKDCKPFESSGRLIAKNTVAAVALANKRRS